MPKFSIIIPVYNTEKYLKKCLDSVFLQNYDNYEIIIVNDGSTDNSDKIVKEYMKKHKNIIYILKENGGLSSARNVGVSKAKGDYLLFLDSDDYYCDNFLFQLSDEINDEDVVRFCVQDVYDNGRVVLYKDKVFDNLDGISSFKYLCECHYVEIACAYCFKRSFWLEHDFMFLEGAYHEDFGLIPFVLISSKKTKCIDLVGYNYFKRDDSISNSIIYEQILKKANDFFKQFIILKNESLKVSGNLTIFNSFIANSVILKSINLKGKDYKKYVSELRKMGAFDMILSDSIGRKIKKFFIKLSPKMYYKIVKR